MIISLEKKRAGFPLCTVPLNGARSPCHAWLSRRASVLSRLSWCHELLPVTPWPISPPPAYAGSPGETRRQNSDSIWQEQKTNQVNLNKCLWIARRLSGSNWPHCLFISSWHVTRNYPRVTHVTLPSHFISLLSVFSVFLISLFFQASATYPAWRLTLPPTTPASRLGTGSLRWSTHLHSTHVNM